MTGRRYRGCTMEPGPIVPKVCDDNVRRLLPDGWVTTCECGWSGRALFQSQLRDAIKAHRDYGWPVACGVSSSRAR